MLDVLKVLLLDFICWLFAEVIAKAPRGLMYYTLGKGGACFQRVGVNTHQLNEQVHAHAHTNTFTIYMRAQFKKFIFSKFLGKTGGICSDVCCTHSFSHASIIIFSLHTTIARFGKEQSSTSCMCTYIFFLSSHSFRRGVACRSNILFTD